MSEIKIIREEKHVIPFKKIRDFHVIGISLPPSQTMTFMGRTTFKNMIEHCNKYRKQKLEAMGFLVGKVYKFNKGHFIVIDECITTELDASLISVKFSKSGLEDLFDKMDLKDRQLVGWYHSHPGFTAFLSETDIKTQTRLFPEPYHIAIVYDPIYRDMKGFSIIKGEIVERIILVHSEYGRLEDDNDDNNKDEDIKWMEE